MKTTWMLVTNKQGIGILVGILGLSLSLPATALATDYNHTNVRVVTEYQQDARRELAMDLPLNRQSIYGAHNSYNHDQDGWINRNQESWGTITNLLNEGIRQLDLDLQWCHRDGTWQIMVNHNRCSTSNEGTPQYIDAIFAEIAAWLNGHPRDFLLLDFEDQLWHDGEVCGHGAFGCYRSVEEDHTARIDLLKQKLAAHFGTRVLYNYERPTLFPAWDPQPEYPQYDPELGWPSPRHLLSQGKQLLVKAAPNAGVINSDGIYLYTGPDYTNSPILGPTDPGVQSRGHQCQYSVSQAFWAKDLTPFFLDQWFARNARVTQNAEQPNDDYPHGFPDNCWQENNRELTSVQEWLGLPPGSMVSYRDDKSTLHTPSKWWWWYAPHHYDPVEQAGYLDRTVSIEEALKCNANILHVDRWSTELLLTTWRPWDSESNDSMRNCAKLTSSTSRYPNYGGLHAANCLESHPFVCTDVITGDVRITSGQGVWALGASMCQSEFGAAFQGPAKPYSIAKLQAAYAPSYEFPTAWVNLTDQRMEGQWRASIPLAINFDSSINSRSKGKIPVATLSTPTFSAPAEVVTSSLTFGRTGDEASLAFCNGNGEDVNGDGLLDLVCHFYTQQTGFQKGDTQAVLKGKMVVGEFLIGSGAVRIVP